MVSPTDESMGRSDVFGGDGGQGGLVGNTPSTGAGENDQREEQDVILRTPPEPADQRKALITYWCSQVKAWKKYYEADFDQMRRNQDFVWGMQWTKNLEDDRYVANITLRHVQQRTAALYAKNPKAVARRRDRILNTAWDGKMSSLNTAQQAVQMGMSPEGMMAASEGGIMGQGMMAGMQTAAVVLADAEKVRAANTQLDKIAKTLELLYEYQIDEQVVPFKKSMKHVVRRGLTCGVSYVKLGFQRAMQKRPDLVGQIGDITQKLARLESLSADLADDQLDPNSKEIEELRLLLNSLQQQNEIIVREGLVFDFPSSTAIIPDMKCKRLNGFIGCDAVAEEYPLTGDQIQEIYNVDVSGTATSYTREDGTDKMRDVERRITASDQSGIEEIKHDQYLVWEIYCKRDGLVYTVCDGYPEFLREPAAPEVFMERFWPWFSFMTNEVDNEERIYPPSDVSLITDQQMEINRMREALREHRIANRPALMTYQGALDENDREKLSNRPGNVVVELNSLNPGQAIDDLLQPLKNPGIDPNMYETQNVFEDILRSVGVSESALGTAGGSVTATEITQAEQARGTSLASNIDDLSDVLTEIARASSQILFLNISKQTVQQIVGMGAVWPELTKTDVAQEIYLEIEAGSAGRPNQMMEIQNMERLLPFLMQMPGIDPQWLTEEIIKRLDDNMDLQQAFLENMPSIVAQNAMATANNRLLAASQGAPSGVASPGGGSPSGGAGEAAQGASNAPASPSAPSQAPGAPPGGVAQQPF